MIEQPDDAQPASTDGWQRGGRVTLVAAGLALVVFVAWPWRAGALRSDTEALARLGLGVLAVAASALHVWLRFAHGIDRHHANAKAEADDFARIAVREAAVLREVRKQTERGESGDDVILLLVDVMAPSGAFEAMVELDPLDAVGFVAGRVFDVLIDPATPRLAFCLDGRCIRCTDVARVGR